MVQPRDGSEKMPVTIGPVQFEIEQAQPMKRRSASSARKAISALFVAIATAASVGYLGFLVGPPVIGASPGVIGLRAALALVLVAAVVISFAALWRRPRNG
jgi:hypothetical protein